MEIAKIQVSGVIAQAVSLQNIPAGIIGAEVAFAYIDPMWDALTKTVVLKGCCTKDIVDAGDTVIVPAEVVATPGVRVYVGVYGVDAAGTIAIPTLWATLGITRAAADPSGDESTDPVLPVWAQIQAQLGDLEELNTESKETLVAAINEALTKGGGTVDEATVYKIVGDYLDENPPGQGADGGYYTPAVTQPDVETMEISFARSNEEMPAVEPVQIKLPVPDSSQNGNGLTAAQISALDGMFKIAAYTEDASEAYAAFKEAFGLLGVAATGITLSVSSLSFTETGSKTITATVEPSDTTGEVVWESSNTSVATVVNGLVAPVANGNCTITATAGSVSASCEVSVAFAAEVEYYSVTNNLTNCASNNSTASIVEGGSYTAILTADDGYTLDGASVSIMVNGEDVTDTAYVDGVITIQSVTGAVVITVVAVEEGAIDSGEVVMLKNISFDGTSYLDTEVIPESVNYRYVIGIQAPNKDVMSVAKNIGGISMRDKTALADSAYWDIYWYAQNKSNNYNADIPSFVMTQSCMALTAAVYAGMDNGNGLASQPYDYPMYYNYDNGAQSVWLNEDCTETPVTGSFSKLTNTVDFTNQSSYTDDEHSIDSIWLGKVHVTGIMSNLATEANTYAGVKFYCFKVYDTNENLIADMRPAKQGSTVGMWDNVRNKFYPATGTANYEEVSA